MAPQTAVPACKGIVEECVDVGYVCAKFTTCSRYTEESGKEFVVPANDHFDFLSSVKEELIRAIGMQMCLFLGHNLTILINLMDYNV